MKKLNYEGIKAKKIKEVNLKKFINLKSRSSYNEILKKKKEKINIKKYFKKLGYYFSKVEIQF